MAYLCSNRPEGFGPSSHLSSPLPTTCFTDVILIPLPVWTYLLTIALLVLLSLYNHQVTYNPSTIHLRAVRRNGIPYKVALTLYYLLILANILMQTLEIVRLCLIHYGVGLLPFSYVALVIGGLLRLTDGGFGRWRLRRSWWVAANVFVWIGLIVMNVVQTTGLVYMEDNGVRLKSSKYPVSDQVIDVAVMAGVYLAITMLEVALAVWKGRRERVVMEEESSGVEEIGLAK